MSINSHISNNTHKTQQEHPRVLPLKEAIAPLKSSIDVKTLNSSQSLVPSYVKEFNMYNIVLIPSTIHLLYPFKQFIHKQAVWSGRSYKLLLKWPFVAVYTRVECEILPASRSNSFKIIIYVFTHVALCTMQPCTMQPCVPCIDVLIKTAGTTAPLCLVCNGQLQRNVN